jgi:hypothetical protein
MHKFILLTDQVEPAGFWFWFFTEIFFGAFVFALLYFFIVKNPKLNKAPENHEKDKP